MGEEIQKTKFTEEDFQLFSQRLRRETQSLKKMLEERVFEYSEKNHVGLEIEAWLLDKNYLPSPQNKTFIKSCGHSKVVEELSQFNFELNTDPQTLYGSCLKNMYQEVKKIWSHCEQKAEELNLNPHLVGIHPMVREEMLQLKYISEGARYKALNDQILRLRNNKPISIHIEGRDQFKKTFDHIMMEAAATSVQVHIQVNQEEFKRFYNASLITSIPSVALAANSPFLFGYHLWEETRIPLFEQSIRIPSFRNKKGEDVGRVTFGTGYVRHSLLELFLENLDAYEPLMPVLFDEEDSLHHLRFHNGTLWRWARPIIGWAKGKPHLRIEQRAMASGPSLKDVLANMAFSLGLTFYLARQSSAPEESMTFTDCHRNFYLAAKDGLSAKVKWMGKTMPLDQLILEDLLPKAKEGLKQCAIDKEDIEEYLQNIIRSRVLTGQTGARWQRGFIDTHGKDFQALAETYGELQKRDIPVHQWKL